MTELIGSLHNLDPGSKFNLQLFPGLKGEWGRGASSHQWDQGSGLDLGCHQSAGSCALCQRYVKAYLLWVGDMIFAQATSVKQQMNGSEKTGGGTVRAAQDPWVIIPFSG